MRIRALDRVARHVDGWFRRRLDAQRAEAAEEDALRLQAARAAAAARGEIVTSLNPDGTRYVCFACAVCGTQSAPRVACECGANEAPPLVASRDTCAFCGEPRDACAYLISATTHSGPAICDGCVDYIAAEVDRKRGGGA